MQMKVYTKTETLIDTENNLMVIKEEKVHSSISEHLGCLHGLAVINSAAVNTVLHVSF